MQLWQRSASDIAQQVRSGETTAVDVTESVLHRLEAVNPAINAVVMQMPDEALDAARAVDAAISRGDNAGILAGVPVTVKVNIDQRGHATTNGLKIQADLVASEDSPVVANLRKAGAVIVGRTNTPAFSLRWFTRNSLHGHTRNPRNRALTPGGSSGGAAAAVAAGIGAIGHGTDIGGSIRYPAYACGVHGIRPSLGRVPSMNPTGADRHIGGQLMAVGGPIARTIADLRLGLAAMSVEDARDPWWSPVAAELPALPRRAALCVAPEGLAVVPEVQAALRDAAARLTAAGWEVEEVDAPPLREPARLQAQLWLAEFRRSGMPALERENDPDANFVFEQMSALCEPPDINGLLDAMQSRVTLLREWQLFLNRYPVLLCPVSAELPFADLLDVESEQAFAGIMEAQLTQVGLPLLGLPGLVVSTGMSGDTPVGVQLVAGRFREDVLFEAGEAIERGGVPDAPVDPTGIGHP